MKILKYWLAFVVFSLPLLFLPFFFQAYNFPKTIYFLVSVLVGWLVWLLARLSGSFQTPDEIYTGDRKTLLLGLFLLLGFTVSALLQPYAPMRVNALAREVVVIASGFLLLLLIRQTAALEPESVKNWLMVGVIAAAVVLALIFIGQYLRVLESLTGWAVLQQAAWSPTGSMLTGLVFVLIGGVCVISAVVEKIRQEKVVISTLAVLLFSLVVLLLGGSLGLLTVFNSDISLINLQNAWLVAVEGFKVFRQALFGVGPGNFQVAYARFRPAAANAAQNWAAYYNSSFGHYLTLLTEVGLVGLLLFAIFVLAGWRRLSQQDQTQTVLWPFLALVVAAFFIHFDTALWMLFFVLLALAGAGDESSFNLPRYLPLGLVGVLLIAGSFWYGRWAWADILFARSVQAFSRGEGGNTYDLQRKAIQYNPYSDTYHILYSRTNLTIAQNFLNQEDLTEQERQQATILVQQAIREAKAAVAANRLWFNNWQNLANTYRQLIGAVQGADQWAIDSYRQAAALNPTNPNLRVSLGGLYFARENFEQAQRSFEQAVSLKPDHANAHYNLAAAYQRQEKWTAAAQELKTVLSLVESDSADFKQVQEDLAAIEEMLPQEEEQPTGEEQLEPPQPMPTTQPTPIEVPEEAAPEIPAEEEPEEAADEEPVEEETEETTPMEEPTITPAP